MLTLLLYDIERLEEDFCILVYFISQVSKKYVDKKTSEQIHAKAKPFIDWLNTAEEESEEDDEEVEVVYTNRSEEAVLKEDAKKEAMKNQPKEEEEDDLDIDDI